MPLPLFAELSRRRVFRALIAYGIAAFAVLQIIEPIMHGLHWPDAVLSYVVVALAIGFPVVVGLEWAFDVKAGRIERAPAGELRGLRLVAVVLALGLAAAAPGVLYFFVGRRPAPEASAPPSIAVLPFVNMSSDKETDYFSDGITEELINALANVDGLRVASRTAVFALKGKALGVQQIGAELNVGTLLEGSIRREGNALRITAQLIKVSDGYHLWSKSYDREPKSIFAVEDEIARSIAAALQRTLVGVKQGTTDLEAHDSYLKGRFFWNKRTGPALRKAAEYFEEAIRRAPAYALAYQGLADTLALLVEYDDAPAAEVLPKAKQAALRALEIDPALGEAHASLGLIATEENQWDAALVEYRKAIELSPNYAMAIMWSGLTQMGTGHLREARASLDRALQLDPTSLIVNENLGEVYLYERDYPAAVKQFKRTLEMEPGFLPSRVNLVRALVLEGKNDEALAEAESLSASEVEGIRALALVRSGHRAEGAELARQIESRAPVKRKARKAALVFTWIALGDYNKAFALLQEVCAQHKMFIALKVAPELDPLRGDPRFAELLRCLNLQ